MKRFLGSAVAMLVALVAIGLVGGDSGAVAGHGCHGRKSGGGLLAKLHAKKGCHGAAAAEAAPACDSGCEAAPAPAPAPAAAASCHGKKRVGLLAKLHAKKASRGCHGAASAAPAADSGCGSCGDSAPASSGCSSCGDASAEYGVEGGAVSSGCSSCGGDSAGYPVEGGMVSGGCPNGDCSGASVISEGVPTLEAAPVAAPAVPTEAPAAPAAVGT